MPPSLSDSDAGDLAPVFFFFIFLVFVDLPIVLEPLLRPIGDLGHVHGDLRREPGDLVREIGDLDLVFLCDMTESGD